MENGLEDRIITGDVLEVLKSLPDEIIDISVTSPPYNKQENKKGWLVKNVEYSHSSDAKPEDLYQQEQILMLNEVFRITKPGGCFFYNHKIRWEKGTLLHPISWLSKSDWTIKQEIIWDRMIAANIRGWRFWQVEERIYWLYKPIKSHLIGKELESRHAKLTSIWRIRPEPNTVHPAPFPLALPARAIYSILGDNKGLMVLDPYCGSGTTLVAAKLLGHHYLGIDISPKYTKMADERIENCIFEIGKLNQEMALHNVSSSFSEKKKNGNFTGKYSPSGNNQKELF